MTDDQVDALEALARTATPGPWVTDDPNHEFIAVVGADGAYEYVADADPTDFSIVRWSRDQMMANAAYIAAANPTAILALITKAREDAADARRFRWLSENHSETGFDPEPLPNMPPSRYHSILWGFWCAPDHSIRDAIDANIRNEPK